MRHRPVRNAELVEEGEEIGGGGWHFFLSSGL
jgi:hypothetical protein